MMKRGFTLVELLVVIGIMGLLGTVSIGGYRAMQRGMAERGVMSNVNVFVRAAYQRAQIDRQPTVVYFWNETIRQATDDTSEIVVGRAVAVRRYGRLTKVDGANLYDEFADLELTYDVDSGGDSGTEKSTMFIYPVDELAQSASGSELKRSVVRTKVSERTLTPLYLTGDENGVLVQGEGNVNEGTSNASQGQITVYGFQVEDAGNVSWKVGTAYGFEFASLELPHNYIFGSSYSTDVGQPVSQAGTLVFDVGRNDGSGLSQANAIGRMVIQVSALRPNSSGLLTAQSIGASDDPSQSL